ncbi:uncharacterized protein LOC120116996 [Hibiscus syriacus]|uniref:uncharacterized protein LOC120116996 n=1 Tax=Hibiscus syriacus TaxID=106335 RepID=UPI0019226D51|nr:uncharacterized protein LOC120116996 [Hibiscus syriacus]
MDYWIRLMSLLENVGLSDSVDDFLAWSGKGDGCSPLKLAGGNSSTFVHIVSGCMDLWSSFWRLWGVSSVLPKDPVSLLSSWSDLRPKSIIWSFIPGVDSLVRDPTLADKHQTREPKRMKDQGWLPPPLHFFKVNVDGAVSGDGLLGGIGGILRYSERKILGSFSHAVGPGPPPLAELKAIEKGIDFSLVGMGDERKVNY